MLCTPPVFLSRRWCPAASRWPPSPPAGSGLANEPTGPPSRASAPVPRVPPTAATSRGRRRDPGVGIAGVIVRPPDRPAAEPIASTRRPGPSRPAIPGIQGRLKIEQPCLNGSPQVRSVVLRAKERRGVERLAQRLSQRLQFRHGCGRDPIGRLLCGGNRRWAGLLGTFARHGGRFLLRLRRQLLRQSGEIRHRSGCFRWQRWNIRQRNRGDRCEHRIREVPGGRLGPHPRSAGASGHNGGRPSAAIDRRTGADTNCHSSPRSISRSWLPSAAPCKPSPTKWQMPTAEDLENGARFPSRNGKP